MTMGVATASADSTGTAVVTITPDKSGVQWTIAQLGVESVPPRGTATATIRLNGRYVTSTIVMPQSAGGQPFINLQYNDQFTVTFSGLTVKDEAIVTYFYNESLWGTIPKADVV